MAKNGNIVCYPLIENPTKRKSARGGGTELIPIPNVVEPGCNCHKEIDPCFKEWLITNPHTRSDVTWNQARTVKTTTYTNVNIVTTDKFSVNSETVIEL